MIVDLSLLKVPVALVGRWLSHFPFIVLGILFISCAREKVLDDIESQYGRPRLVVHALLSPGDSVLVNLGQTLSLGDTALAGKVVDASVVLRNERGEAVELSLLRTTPQAGVYAVGQNIFPIQANTIYQLTVTHPNFPDVTASCKIPAVATPIREFTYTGKSLIPDDSNEQYDVVLRWQNSNDLLHRVYFVGSYQQTATGSNSVLDEGITYQGLDPFHGILQTGDWYSYQTSFFATGVFYPDLDTLADGTILAGRIVSTEITYQLDAYLVTPDIHMARYQESQEIFAQNRDALNSSSFIELYRGVIPEYTNIEGGLGVFGAYLRSEPKSLRLE